MAFSVWKITLSPDNQTALLPAGAIPLHVHEQYGEICVWFKVNPDAEKFLRTFRVVGTGHSFEGFGDNYLGTAHLEGGSLVFHVFEVVGRP